MPTLITLGAASVLGLLGSAGPSLTGLTVVYDGAGASGTSEVSYGSTTTAIPAGSNIIIFIAVRGDNSNVFPEAFEDSAGNVYTPISSSGGAFYSESSLSIFSCPNCVELPSNGSIVVNFIGGYNFYGIITYAQGFNGGPDSADTNQANDVSTISVSTGALKYSTELVVAFLATDSLGDGLAGEFVESSGFTSVASVVDLEFCYDIAYCLTTSTASVTYSPSWTTAADCNAVIASFTV